MTITAPLLPARRPRPRAGRRLVAALLVLLGIVPFSRAADPVGFTVGSFVFQRPSSWAWVPVNTAGMRKAQLRVADPSNPGGPGAEVVFFFFGAGQGGGVEANVARWLGQFREPEEQLKPVVETATVKATKVTRVRVNQGTFNSGMPGGPTAPQANYGLYGAILESPQGDVFIKLTGPAEVVNAAGPSFEQMVLSPFQAGGR